MGRHRLRPATAAAMRGMGQNAAFSPADIAGLKMWLDGSVGSSLYQDAGKTTSVVLDGNPVGAAADQSGNGNDALQATAADQPTYETNQINSRSAVGFDSAGTEHMATAAFAAELSQPNTIVIVGYTENTGANHVICDGIANGKRHLIAYDGAVGPNFRINAGTNLSSGVTAFNAPTILVITFNGASSTIHRNGVLIGSGNAGANPLSGFTWGAAYTGGNEFRGYQGEVIVYDSALNDTNRALVETYLGTKWNVALPP